MHEFFFQVIDGFDALDKLERLPVNAKQKPIQPTKLNNITIHANPIAEEGDDH